MRACVRACVRVCDTEEKVLETTADISHAKAKQKFQQSKTDQLILIEKQLNRKAFHACLNEASHLIALFFLTFAQKHSLQLDSRN